jgi:hypothetical protein
MACLLGVFELIIDSICECLDSFNKVGCGIWKEIIPQN